MRPGQIHFVLGWMIVVVSHNWPMLLALVVTGAQAITLWRSPTRRRVASLYGFALLVIAYEYQKHIGPQLQDAANYLLMFELLPLNRAIYLFVGPVLSTALVGLALGFIGYAFVFAERGHGASSSTKQIGNCKNTT